MNVTGLLKYAQASYDEQLEEIERENRRLERAQNRTQKDIKGQETKALSQEIGSSVGGAALGALGASMKKGHRTPLNAILGASAGSVVGGLGGRAASNQTRGDIFDEKNKLESIKEKKNANLQRELALKRPPVIATPDQNQQFPQ